MAAAPAGTGGAPFAPGTGRELVFGGSLVPPCPGGKAAGAIGTAGGGVADFATGLFATLGGTGNLPCWISVARCLTEGGSGGVIAVTGGGLVGAGAPGAAAGAVGGGWLMTLLMTVVL